MPRVGASYITCLAAALTSADQRGVCSRLPLLTYRLDSFKEAQPYAENCPDFGKELGTDLSCVLCSPPVIGSVCVVGGGARWWREKG